MIAPPFTALAALGAALAGTAVALAAQNVHPEAQGAYTGEVSAAMLKGLAGYVIIGHSERRQYFAETDESVNKKIFAALAHGIVPIVCVGEDLAQNQAGATQTFVSAQVRAAFARISADQARAVVVAYEPIWAIGTARPPPPQAPRPLSASTSAVRSRRCTTRRPPPPFASSTVPA